MKLRWIIVPALLLQAAGSDQETSTIYTYVDSDICARLMLGPINPKRIQCSQSTVKEGSSPVLVRLSNNMVFLPNKTKPLKPLVGQFAKVSGNLKVKDGTLKLLEATPIEVSAIPTNEEDLKILDPNGTRQVNPQTWEKVRHELAMLPYLSDFDFISFTMADAQVILTGWTVRQTNRSDAYNAVRDVPGVETVVNNIEILPLGSFDMQIRAGVRAVLQRQLSRYFWGSGSDIKIVVKDGMVILLGIVSNQGDYDIANIQANTVPGVFKVFNMLRVQSSPKKG
jgi:hyperosmotically inducible protein